MFSANVRVIFLIKNKLVLNDYKMYKSARNVKKNSAAYGGSTSAPPPPSPFKEMMFVSF